MAPRRVHLDNTTPSCKFKKPCNRRLFLFLTTYYVTIYGWMDDRPDLAELAEHVRTIHWHGLGLQLGLENDDLSSIRCSITEGCRTEMFNSWLKKSINATRRQLLEALRSSAVAEIHMAECYEKYIFDLSRRGKCTQYCCTHITYM